MQLPGNLKRLLLVAAAAVLVCLSFALGYHTCWHAITAQEARSGIQLLQTPEGRLAYRLAVENMRYRTVLQGHGIDPEKAGVAR